MSTGQPNVTVDWDTHPQHPQLQRQTSVVRTPVSGQPHRSPARDASEQHYRSLKYPTYESASNYSLATRQEAAAAAAAAAVANYNRNSVYGYASASRTSLVDDRRSIVDDRRSVIENPLLEEDEEEELLPPPTFNNHGSNANSGPPSQQLPPLPPPPPPAQQLTKSRSIYSCHAEAAAQAASDAHERFHYRSPSYSKHVWHQEADSDSEEETGCHKTLEKIDWEEIAFYVKVVVFGILVFLLPLTPMLMFVCTETSPSIHPDVLNYIKNVGNQAAEGSGDGGHAAESKEGGLPST